MSITHAKISAKADGADATRVRPSDWNDVHVVGSGVLKSHTVTFTSADLLDFHNTPKVLVPAPGAGKAILLPSIPVFAAYTFGTTPYTLVGLPAEILYHYEGFTAAPGDGGLVNWYYLDFADLLDQSADTVQFGTLDGIWNRIYTAPRGDIENKAIMGSAYPGKSLTLGDGTLDVTTPYVIVDLP